MQNYFEMLNIKEGATPTDASFAFRRLAVRYRATTTADQLIADQRFRQFINAYLTLTDSKLHAKYLERWNSTKRASLPDLLPFDTFPPEERQMLMAQIAFWRREQIEALHTLRELVDRYPNHANAHAMMGEVYFQVGRIDDGIHSYQRAVKEAPANTQFADRLHHALQAQAGVVELYIEPSIEEQMLAEERRQRRWKMIGICCVGLLFICYVFIRPQQLSESFNIPWKSVWMLLPALFLLMFGLAYGRLLDPYERVMVFNGVSVGSRGSVRNYPYGLLLFVTCAISLLLGVCYLVAIAVIEEEWPTSTSILLGICVAIVAILSVLVHIASPYNWVGTLIFGGNFLAIAGIIGWWAGSMGTTDNFT